VQTPYYQYGPNKFWEPYAQNVYPNQHNPVASNNSKSEHIPSLLEELDKLKDEAMRYKKAEVEHLAELQQTVEDLRKEVRELEKQEAREEENVATQRAELVVTPQPLPPAYVLNQHDSAVFDILETERANNLFEEHERLKDEA